MAQDTQSILKQSLELHEGELLRYAERLLNNGEAAQDIVQDVFLKLWKQPPADLNSHLRAWLFKVCHNLIIDRKRKEQHMARFTAEQQAQGEPQTSGGMRIVEDKETQSEIQQALNTLTDKQKEVVRLKFQNGFSYNEIAQITGMSVNNVGNTVHKAMQKLKQTLEEKKLETTQSRSVL